MTDQPPDGPIRDTYTERLRTPWWWYGGAVVVAALLGVEFAIAASGWIAVVPLAVLLPLCLLVVWRLSSARITVRPNELTAGDRRLDLRAVDAAIGLSETELRRLVGRHADPSAYTFIRSWVGPGVQLVLSAPTGAGSRHSVGCDDDGDASQDSGARDAGRSHPDGLNYEDGPDYEDGPNYEEDDSSYAAPRGPAEPYWVISTRYPDRLLSALAASSVPIVSV